MAFSESGREWFLINATPDIHWQIETNSFLHPPAGERGTPIREILLTDAQLDHVLGLLMLREGDDLVVHATGAVLGALRSDFAVREMLAAYSRVTWRVVDQGERIRLSEDIAVDPFSVGEKPPRYVRAGAASAEWVTGYRITDLRTAGSIVYAPCVGTWREDLTTSLEGSDCVFFDGTFWQADELAASRAGTRNATEMGHLPIVGEGGSAEPFQALDCSRKVYVHLNNTNPLVADSSAERVLLERLGIEVGFDGMELEV